MSWGAIYVLMTCSTRAVRVGGRRSPPGWRARSAALEDVKKVLTTDGRAHGRRWSCGPRRAAVDVEAFYTAGGYSGVLLTRKLDYSIQTIYINSQF